MFRSKVHLFLFSLVFWSVSADDDNIVTIAQGKLKGIELTSRSGRNYYGFLGIPFVDKPERFQAPSFLPPKSWEGVRDATVHGPLCIQFDVVKNKALGEEDCLFLNVNTPNTKGKLPVMVYIHGGGFQWGTSHTHGGKYFMDEDVVLVTFNYRLGAFGFLSTGDTIIQGNMGMKDQVAALKWVQSNIEQFGGDPNLVTIFGESAGGGAVSLQVLSPMSKGLFQHAIAQSGAALNPWSCLKNPRYGANELGQKLNCSINNSQDLLTCLNQKTSEELAGQSFAKWYLDPTVPFGPVVEQLRPNQSAGDVFLSRAPFEILSEGSFNQVPFMTGICEDEGIYFHSSSILKEKQLESDVNNDWHRIAPISLTYYDDDSVSQQELNLISDSIKSYYFKDQPISENTRQQLTNLYSDRYFVHGVRTTALIQAKHLVPVYIYMFAYKGSFSFLQDRGFEKGLGVTHKDELQYLFNGLAPELKPGPDEDLSRHLVKLWTNFAATGKPTSTWGAAKVWKPIPIKEAIRMEPLQWYRIDTNTSVIEQTFAQRMSYWDNLMLQHSVVSYPRHVEQI
ncbi:unnamed protein product [Allacma fusca]|uniref:Carboxylic ester hydrolase n=1 Tax=Allacma fusca TaxID=39272 RepID=A0A8J2PAD3_9HEXA|nr:unnamed protein product [Allacma fusca]